MIKKSHARPVEKNMADRLVKTAKRSEFEIILIDVQSVHYPRFLKRKIESEANETIARKV